MLRVGGVVYTVTDVEELAGWMRERFSDFGREAGGGGSWEGLFEEVEVPGEGEEEDWVERGGEEARVALFVRCIREETEEGKKVARNGGKRFVSVWRRREDPPWPGEGGV